MSKSWEVSSWLGVLEGSFRKRHGGRGGEREMEQEAIFSQKSCFIYLGFTKYWSGIKGTWIGLHAMSEM